MCMTAGRRERTLSMSLSIGVPAPRSPDPQVVHQVVHQVGHFLSPLLLLPRHGHRHFTKRRQSLHQSVMVIACAQLRRRAKYGIGNTSPVIRSASQRHMSLIAAVYKVVTRR